MEANGPKGHEGLPLGFLGVSLKDSSSSCEAKTDLRPWSHEHSHLQPIQSLEDTESAKTQAGAILPGLGTEAEACLQ